MLPAEALLGITFFIVIFSVFYVYLTTRSKERMALIEKGESASIFSDQGSRKINDKYRALKFGLLSMGIGAGFLIANILSTYLPLSEEPTFFSCIFLGGGIGLITYYGIRTSQEEKENL